MGRDNTLEWEAVAKLRKVRSAVTVDEVNGKWRVTVVDKGVVESTEFSIESFALNYAAGQRKRLRLDDEPEPDGRSTD